MERRLAFFMAVCGDWVASEPTVEMEDGVLKWVDIAFSPEESVPEQGFNLVGSLSSMLSRKYQRMTSSGSVVQKLVPPSEPEQFGVQIPEGYVGKALPLWILQCRPPDSARATNESGGDR